MTSKFIPVKTAQLNELECEEAMVWAVFGISLGGVVGITLANLGLRVVLRVLQPSLEAPAAE